MPSGQAQASRHGSFVTSPTPFSIFWCNISYGVKVSYSYDRFSKRSFFPRFIWGPGSLVNRGKLNSDELPAFDPEERLRWISQFLAFHLILELTLCVRRRFLKILIVSIEWNFIYIN